MQHHSEKEPHAQNMGDDGAVMENQELFHLLVDSVKDYAIFALDPEGRVATWNSGAAHLKGYRAEEILGRHFSVFYPLQDAADGRLELQLEIARMQGRYAGEGWRVRKDGSLFWADVTITPIRDPEGLLRGYAKVIRDLTEQRQVQMAARESAALQTTILNSMVSHIVVLDHQGVIQATNESWRRFARENGAEDDRAIGVGSSYLEVCLTADGEFAAEAPAAYQGIKKVIDGVLDSFTLEYPCHSPEAQRWFLMSATPLDTAAQGAVISHMNITARRQAEEASARSAARLAEAQRIARMGSFEYDVETGAIVWSEQVYRLFERESALGPPSFEEFLSYVHPDDRSAVTGYATSGIEKELVFRLRRADGTVRYVYLLHEVLADAHGNPVRISGTMMDITERKAAEDALQKSEARFRSAIGAMNEGLILQNQAGEIEIFNRRAGEILGLTEDQMRGRVSLDPRWKAIHEDETPWPGDTHPAMVALREGIEQSQVVMGIHKPNGKLTWVSINAVPLFHVGDSQPNAVVVTFTDITERKWFEEQIATQVTWTNEANVQMHLQQAELEEANARLATLATMDGLTGLKNHRAFQEKLVEEYGRAQRYKTPLSLLLLDVDHFKPFNDQFGHPAGDQVLKQVAAALQSAGRATDFTARYGGEEFVMILPDTNPEGALKLGERVRANVAAQRWEQRAITISVGATTLHAATESSAELVTEADQALYQSKAAGRNRVTHFRIKPAAP